MDPEHSAPVPPRFHVWLEGRKVVAAAYVWASGYFWCQSWRSDDLPAAALAAAEPWGVTPQSPPRNDFMGPVTWLRTIIPLAKLGGRDDGVIGPDDVPNDDPEGFVRDLVSSGLDEPTMLTTLSWPSLDLETVERAPDPSIAAFVTDRLDALALENAAAHALAREKAEQREAERRLAEIADAAARREAVVTRYADTVLTIDQFVAAVITGCREHHLYTWTDALIASIERPGPLSGDGSLRALARILNETVRLGRHELDPFAGITEAPEIVHRLWQGSRDDFEDLSAQRDEVFSILLREIAPAYYSLAGGPFRWGVLIERGAWPVRPDAPPPDDW